MRGFGFDGKGADVEAALRACCGPGGEIGLHSDIGHLELHAAVQGRDIACHTGSDMDVGHQILLDVEGHPYVAHIENRHYGITRSDQFAGFGDDRRNLARYRGVNQGIRKIGLHFRNGAFGLPYLGGCRLFLLLAGSVEYQFALRFGRTLGRLHRLQVGAGFIQLLGRNDALFIEVVHAVEGFLGQQQSCLGFFPEIQCGFLLLDTGAGEGFLVHGRCGALHGFGLLQLGIQFGGRERVEQFALGDVLSLLYFHLLDTAGNFRRSFVCSTFHRSLDVQGRGLA